MPLWGQLIKSDLRDFLSPSIKGERVGSLNPYPWIRYNSIDILIGKLRLIFNSCKQCVAIGHTSFMYMCKSTNLVLVSGETNP
jgi:hypothetical protein